MTITSSINLATSNSLKTTDHSENKNLNNTKEQTRYEMLLNMKWEDMTEAERAEKEHYNAMRPVKYLDEAGNEALNKALEGKTDTEKFIIKSTMELMFMTSIKANSKGGLDRQKFDSIDTSKNATISRFETYMQDFQKNGGVDEIGLMDVMNNFLNIYKASDPSNDLKNQEDSVIDKFLEDLYSKESISIASSVTKEKIQTKLDEFHQSLVQEFGDSSESKNIISKKLDDYKKQLLDELKTSLSDENTKKTDLEKQSIVKVLLDEQVTDTNNFLETLLQ